MTAAPPCPAICGDPMPRQTKRLPPRFSLRSLPRFLPTTAALLVTLGLAAAAAFTAFDPPPANARNAGYAGRDLRIGVPWIPPAEGSESRLYMEEGFELDLAVEVANGLGARAVLVPLAPGSARRALANGEADLVLERVPATAGPQVGVRALSTGYHSGLTVAMRSDKPLSSWSDLAGRTVCVSQANAQARALGEQLGARVKEMRAPAPALMAVRTGECEAAIHDAVLLAPLFAKKSWLKFSASLPARDETQLRIAVAAGAPRLARAVETTLAALDTPERWTTRAERWASTVSFEVYRDQVAADCH